MANSKSVDSPAATHPQASDKRSWPRTLLRVILPLIIVGIGILGADYFRKTVPKARKHPPTAVATLVQVQPLKRQSQRVAVKAMGTVVAARRIELKSRVTGEILKIHNDFIEGGLLNKGAELVRIDPRDYQLALAQKKRALADARYEFEVEQGYQAVAKREWELLGSSDRGEAKNAELALRKPHLKRARARLEAAQADLEQAELNLKRTIIPAPFNAIVLAKHIDVRSRINVNEPLATLVDTDQFWVRISVPLDRLKWIQLPTASNPIGASATVYYRDQFHRSATVTKLLNDLGEAGQMARLIATVADPLGLKSSNAPPLLIGEVVEVELEGGQINQAIQIPRRALRDQDRVWLMSSDGQLEIRPVIIAWRGDDAPNAKGNLSFLVP